MLPKLFGQGFNIHGLAKYTLFGIGIKVYNAKNLKATKELRGR